MGRGLAQIDQSTSSTELRKLRSTEKRSVGSVGEVSGQPTTTRLHIACETRNSSTKTLISSGNGRSVAKGKDYIIFSLGVVFTYRVFNYRPV